MPSTLARKLRQQDEYTATQRVRRREESEGKAVRETEEEKDICIIDMRSIERPSPTLHLGVVWVFVEKRDVCLFAITNVPIT